nr:MAG TPA: hypothetical protein [Caudoviricetes sp.]
MISFLSLIFGSRTLMNCKVKLHQYWDKFLLTIFTFLVMAF